MSDREIGSGGDCARLEALLRLRRQQGLSERELVDFAVEEAVRLTDSEIGFIHLVDELRGEIRLMACSSSAVEPCTGGGEPTCSVAVAGPWAECVRDRQPVVNNDPEGLRRCGPWPDGSPSVIRHLGVPVMDNGRVVAIAAVCNKPSDYDADDAKRLALLASGWWEIHERRKVERDLLELTERLEQRVTERTAEIERINQALRDVAEGVSAAVGEQFFQSLVLHLASSLEVDFAFVGRLADPDATMVETLAIAMGSEIVDNITYQLAGSPCESVTTSGLVCIPDGVQELFPNDEILRELGIRSYAGTPLRDSRGAVLGVLVVLRSTPLGSRASEVRSVLQVFAARASAELERLQNEAELQIKDRALASTVSAMALVGLDGSLSFVNEAYLRMWGLEEAAEVVGSSAVECWRDRAAARDVLGTILEQGSWTGELTAVRRDGTEFVTQFAGNLVTDGVGRPTCMIASVVDITARKRAEAALRESQARYELATSAGKVGVWDWEIPSDTLFVDARLRAMLGRGDERAPARMADWLAVIHPDDLAEIEEAVGACIAGRTAGFETAHRVLPDQDGGRWMLARGNLVRDADGRPARLVGTTTDITDLRSAQQTILDQNRFLNSVIEALTHPLSVIDADDYTIRLANSAAGVPGDGPVTCHELSHHLTQPCSVGEHVCPLEEIKRTGRAVVVEHEHLDEDDNVRHVEIHGYPVFGEDGRLLQVIEYSLDVTERRRVEEELRHRNQELTLLNWIITAGWDLDRSAVLDTACRRLAESLHAPRAAIALLDIDGRELHVAAECAPVEGPPLAPRVMAASSFQLFQVLSEAKQPVRFNDAPSDARLESMRGELEMRSTRSILGAPLFVEGDVAGQIWIESDRQDGFTSKDESLLATVSAQLGASVARLRLEQTRRRLQAAVEQIGDAVVITDAGGRIEYVNPAFVKTAGLELAEVIGRSARWLEQARRDEPGLQNLWQTISDGRTWSGRLSGRRPDGTPIIEDVVVTPVRDAAGKVVSFVAISRDVTTAVHLEAQYRQAQRMESVGRLAGGVAHDFNNLLAAIIGYAELGLAALSEDHPIYDDLREIRDTSERAAELTSQLLTFARRQAVEPQRIDLGQVIHELDNMLRRLIGEQIELVVNSAADLQPVFADRSSLEQVVVNLVVNARDAMPMGGRLTLTTSNLSVTARDRIPAAGVTPGEYVLVTVADTGVGMADDVREHVFEPFFTTKEAGQGTGLGLAICFGIVTQSGGKIWIDSAPGFGTAVTVLLPRAPLVGLSVPPESNLADVELLGGSESILLVEDDPTLRRVLERVLSGCGYRVHEAGNGADALSLVERLEEPVDLLISDVILPGLGGIYLARQLRTLFPRTKLLFISGHSGEPLASADHGLGGRFEFLRKPFSTAALARAVRSALDR